MLRYTKFAVEGHAQTKIMQISIFSTPKNYKNAGVFAFLRQIWRKNLALFADDEVAYLLLLLTRITIKSVKNIQKHSKKKKKKKNIENTKRIVGGEMHDTDAPTCFAQILLKSRANPYGKPNMLKQAPIDDYQNLS